MLRAGALAYRLYPWRTGLHQTLAIKGLFGQTIILNAQKNTDFMIKAILIDDEQGAQLALSALLQHYCPEVQVLARCSNVPDAVLAINKHEPEVVFLDIEMPEYNGFELFDFFKNIDFEVIFVTAYSEYAFRALELSAVDYLVKPVDIDLLLAAVEKLKQRQRSKQDQQRYELLRQAYQGQAVSKIVLPMSDGLLFVDLGDILLLEAQRAYTQVCLKDGTKHLVSKNIRNFEAALMEHPQFFRPHRSYIVNLNCIKQYLRKESLLIFGVADWQIPLSRDRKNDFEQLLKDLKILI